MRVTATVLVKGSSGIATTDTIGLRYGSDYASATEFAVFTPSTPSIITSLLSAYGGGYLLNSSAAWYLLGAPAGNTLVFLCFREDADSDGRLWIRRNSTQLASSVATFTDLGAFINWEGRVRSRSELESYFRAAIVSGVDAGLSATSRAFT